jgi:hypothetical protein
VANTLDIVSSSVMVWTTRVANTLDIVELVVVTVKGY